MRPIVAISIVSAVVLFFQSKALHSITTLSTTQYSGTAGETIDSVEEWFASSFGFDQVFGTENTTTTTIKNNASPNNDKPPPRDTWLLDSNSFTPADEHSIPRIINKIYFQKGSGFPPRDSMPAGLTAAHTSWKEMNPGYDIRYYDLEQARRYLRQHFNPVFLRAFDCLPAFAAKSDLFRMTLLYREGGWHSDWKQVCLEKYVLQNITETTDFYADYDMWESHDFFKHKCVQNAFVGSKPKHPIIETMLEMILINIQTSRYSGSALDATATCIFGRAIHVSEEERNSQWFSQVAGNFINDPIHGGAFQFAGKTVVKHKCDDCGGHNQDWGQLGNNYLELYKQRNFYCQDAASLFIV